MMGIERFEEWMDGISSDVRGVEYTENGMTHRRLQIEFLKRLDGHMVHIGVNDMFGYETDPMLCDSRFRFDLDALMAHGMTSVFPYSTDAGQSGDIRVDWLTRTVTVTGMSEDGEAEFYPVSRMLVYAVSRVDLYSLEFGLLFDLSTAPIEMDAVENPLYTVDRIAIEMALAAQVKGRGYLPDYPVTAKEVSYFTGIPQSTLSDLKNGKKSIENLTYQTLSALTLYGNIKEVEGYVHDVCTGVILRQQPRITHFDVVFEMKDGTIFRVKSTSHDSATLLYNAYASAFDNGRGALDVEHAVLLNGDRRSRLMLPTRDIAYISIQEALPLSV